MGVANLGQIALQAREGAWLAARRGVASTELIQLHHKWGKGAGLQPKGGGVCERGVAKQEGRIWVNFGGNFGGFWLNFDEFFLNFDQISGDFS